MPENNRGSSQLEYLPAGLLLASSLVLNSPHDHHIHTVVFPIFIVLFSVLILVYRSILQAANFPRIFGVLALCCELRRAIFYIRAPNNAEVKSLKGEVISCLRDIVIVSTYACLILLTSRFPQTGNELGQGRNDVETAPLAPPVGVPSKSSWDSSSMPDNSDHILNNDPLLFSHLGPSSSYHGSSGSVISLSPVNTRVKQDVMQTMTAAKWLELDHDEDTSTKVEIDT